MQVKYVFHKLVGFPSVKMKDFFAETLDKGQGLINSDEMRKRIFDNTYPAKNFLGKTVQTKGMYGLDISLEQFYKQIMEGNERAGEDGPDHEIDLLVRVKRMAPGVLGSMSPGNPWYNLSSDFLAKCYQQQRPHDLFGNNFHEYGHHLGHYHSTKVKSRRQYDPAYTMGRIGRNMFLEGYPLTNGIVVNLALQAEFESDDSKWINSTCI